MSDKVFLDTNILIYLYSEDERTKRSVARKLFSNHQNIKISTQILSEFSNVHYRKLKINPDEISEMILEISRNCDVKPINISTVTNALAILNRYKYAFFDSLILSTAIENNCNILYSEDMHAGHVLENTITIINPFESIKETTS